MIIGFTLLNRKGQAFHATIDDSDIELLERVWHTCIGKYTVYISGKDKARKGKQIPMHRLIMERALGRKLERREEVDHIDLNGLNNTRENLRIATRSQNAANRRTQRNNKSGFKGVHWHKGKFEATIQVNRKTIYLGVFVTPEEAHVAYVEASKRYFGGYSRTE